MARVARKNAAEIPADIDSTVTRILRSARAVFYEKGFFDCSVDEIAKRSYLSRATIYLHFKNKNEILIEILKEDLELQSEYYVKLTKVSGISYGKLKKWIIDIRQKQEDNRKSLGLFLSGSMISPQVSELVAQYRAMAISTLGGHFSGFDVRLVDPGLRSTQYAKCYIMITLIEGITHSFSNDSSTPDVKVGIELLAKSLLSFLKDGNIIL